MREIFFYLILLSLIGCGESSSNHKDNKKEIIKNVKTVKTGETFYYQIQNGKNIKLKNAPKGMNVYPDGTVVWTPTDNQAGSYNVEIYENNKLLEKLPIEVLYKPVEYKGYFVDFSYKGEENGTPDKPFNSIKEACEKIMEENYEKTNIYIRGGVYKNKGFGESLENGSFQLIKDCSGVSDRYIHIKPWKEERVILLSDGAAVFAIRNSSYISIENLELKGVADKISFEDALKYWWESKPYYKGSGISINRECHHIHLKNNIIHDFPGAGIAIHNSDAIKVENNVVYNCVWWSIAGTGGIVLTQSKELAEDESFIKGNLIFGVESRIFSRVFKKGFAKLVIDEGEAILVQEEKDTGEYVEEYNKNYHIKDNFLAFNGKGIVVNKADKAYVENNSMYLSKSLRVGGSSSDVHISKNAVEVGNNETWISISRDASNIYVYNNVYNQSARKKYNRNNPSIFIENNIPVDHVFENPLIFSLSPEVKDSGSGASESSWKGIDNLLRKYKIKIKSTNWVIIQEKIEYMTEAILKGAKNLSPDVVIDCRFLSSDNPKILIKNLPEDFVEKNSLPSTTFKLYLKYPYSGKYCDIK